MGDEALIARLDELAPAEGPNSVDVWAGLTIHRFCGPAILRRAEFDSLSVGFIAQATGAVAYVVTAEGSNIDLQITAASLEHPVFYSALHIDPQLVRSISSSMYPLSVAGERADPSDAPALSTLDDELMDAVIGFLASLSSSCDRRVLAPLRMSEMVYRLLQREQRTRLLRLSSDELLRNPIAAALSHIADHLAEPLSASALAVHVHMSPSAFSRAFREATGRPPYQYIKDRRLDRARDLLDDRTFGVAAVAGAVGYSSVSHFIKEFHRRFGSTPGEYAETSAQLFHSSSTSRQEHRHSVSVQRLTSIDRNHHHD
ncbi:Transcriptional regulator, AraC family [uncultured Mycobacterium sp.]|uniref:Transcriptional regulator, AraC family n=1 Tax=uncultured Mycobacterium sp. TaxID=171292 RepID=A0A1Y5PCU9_9MYCO|nr:Transcriptional regulator, AraC family [uncultured Mycobacterium sp.]